jgi:molybdopterin-guanine dinucleotide biosynthesis protein A
MKGECLTMLAMAERGKKPAKKPNRSKTPLQIWLERDLREALDKFVETDRRKITTVVSMALEKFLQEQGAWTPRK